MTPDRLLTLLIETALKGTSLLIVAALLVLLLRRGSAAHRHLVWACALAGLVALPIMLVALPAWRVSAPSVAWLAPRSGPVQRALQPDAPPLVAAGDATARSSAQERAEPALAEPAPPAEATSSPAAPADRARTAWPTVALTLWAAGALAALLVFLAGHAMLRRLVRHAHPVREGEWRVLAIEAADRLGLTLPFALLRSDGVAVPVAFGLVRPRVLLPGCADEWTVEARRAVLLHELAHVQRHDCLTQAMAQIACALFWFHPGVWWAASRLQVERERACDDRVLGARTRASDYADHLLGMVRSLRSTRRAAWGAVAFARRSSLEGRLLAVLDPFRDRRAVGFRVVAPAALIAALLILPFAAFQPVAAGSRSTESRPPKQYTTTGPKALRPTRVIAVPNPDQSLEQRAAWARAEAAKAREKVISIGWLIETHSGRKGNLLSDTDGISIDLLGERGAFTLEDVLEGRERGTWNPDDHSAGDERGSKSAAMLVRMTGGVLDRVRVQSPGLPVAFGGGPLYWLDRVPEEQSFAWVRDAASRARDERIRGQLVESVSFMRNSQLVTPYLMATFRGSGPAEVRAGAAEGLARHPSPDAVRLLADAARTDRSPEVRRACVEALGHSQTPEALDALLAIAKASEGPEQRAAFDALGEEVSRQAPDDIAPVGQADPEDDVRAMNEAPDPRGDSEPRDQEPPDEPSMPMDVDELEVQRQAIESLGRYPESQSLQRLRRIVETSPNEDLRAQAVESIARIGTPAAFSAVQDVAWKNRQSRARAAAVEAIGRYMPSDKALDELVRIARTHPSLETRRTAVEMVGRLDTPQARVTLEKIVAEGTDVDSQRQAVESLGRRGDVDIESKLTEIARTHRSIEVRREAVESLGRTEGSAERMMSIATSDVPEEVQRQAAESLGRIDDPRAKGMLLELARTHPSIEVERQAVESLGRLEIDVMDDLAQIAGTHRSSEVRRQAVESMTRRDPDQALRLLEEMLRKPKQKSGT